MKPIPAFKNNSLKYFFTISHSTKQEIYLFTEKEVVRILPKVAYSVTIGEPYKELARITYLIENREESIDISLENLVRLLVMLLSIGLNLYLDSKLQKYIDSMEKN